MSAIRYEVLKRPTRVILAFALVAFLTTAVAESQVTVTVEVTGEAVPGATVTATATIEVSDGSEVQSIMWIQTGGADAMLSGIATDTLTVTLGSEMSYRDYLIHVLSEPPIGEEQLPPNVPLPEGEFPGGLQDRFQVVGISPFSLEHAGMVTLEAEVATSSGTYRGEGEVHAHLPWTPAHGIHNVPLGVQVLLHGKSQSYYNWVMGTPSGSAATLVDPSSQSPWFAPDVAGRYWLTVNDEESGENVSLNLFAGTWKGIIVAQDDNGRPIVDRACFNCHNDQIAPDNFTDWAQTGHAEIFTNNLNTSTHYGPNCFACHTVGFDTGAGNGGIDDASDYQDFLDSGLINTPGDNWTHDARGVPGDGAARPTSSARTATVRRTAVAHTQRGRARRASRPTSAPPATASRCATPASSSGSSSAHANYELAIDEGDSGKLLALPHRQRLPGLAAGPARRRARRSDWTASTSPGPRTRPIRRPASACHDPHAIGTTSGSDTNATVRISGDTPPLHRRLHRHRRRPRRDLHDLPQLAARPAQRRQLR